MREATIDSFLKQFKSLLYRRRERIVLPDDEGTNIYYVKQGYVRQNTLSSEGTEFTPYIFSPGDFFPLVWFDDELLNEHYYESLTPAEVYRLPRSELLSFLAKDTNTSSVLTGQLMAYSTELLKKVESKILGSAEKVIIKTLLDLSRLFGKREEKKIVINYWFTHQDIANIAGLSREVITKHLSKLVAKKIISYKHHLIIIENLLLLKTELGAI